MPDLRWRRRQDHHWSAPRRSLRHRGGGRRCQRRRQPVGLAWRAFRQMRTESSQRRRIGAEHIQQPPTAREGVERLPRRMAWREAEELVERWPESPNAVREVRQEPGAGGTDRARTARGGLRLDEYHVLRPAFLAGDRGGQPALGEIAP